MADTVLDFQAYCGRLRGKKDYRSETNERPTLSTVNLSKRNRSLACFYVRQAALLLGRLGAEEKHISWLLEECLDLLETQECNVGSEQLSQSESVHVPALR